jgi:hypothetical protein
VINYNGGCYPPENRGGYPRKGGGNRRNRPRDSAWPSYALDRRREARHRGAIRGWEAVMFGRVRGLSLALVACAALAWSAPGHAANWLEMNFWLSGPRYDGALPQCEAAVGQITYSFEQKESRFWNSSLQILGFTNIREIAFRPWANDTIPRRFCSAQAQITDGRWHSVNYSIAEDTDLVGARWGVQWCVVGLDRNWAYNPACRMARP